MKKYLLLLLSILVLTGCGKKSYDMYKAPEEVKIELNENIFKVFTEHNTNDLIKNSNVDIIENNIIDTNEIGKHTYTLLYKFNDKKYKYDITYEVIDDEAPKFIYSPMYINVAIGDDVILCDRIKYGDNYDDSIFVVTKNELP